MALELDRWARHYSIEMKMNPHFPFNTIRLMRGAVAALRQGRFAAYHPQMYRAVWSEGRNLGKEDVLRELLASSGIDPASIDGDEIKNELRANTDGAVARGAFGAPTFYVNGEIFWGNDRLDFVDDALKRAA